MAKIKKSVGFGGVQVTSFDQGDDATAYEIWKDLADDLAEIRTRLAGFSDSVTHNFASLVDGAGESKDVTVTGAVLGDFCLTSVGVDAGGMLMSAAVKSADIITVRAQNETAGTVDLASTTLRVGVLAKARASTVGLLGSTTWDPGSLADGVGESTDVTVAGAKLGDYALASLGVDGQGISLFANVTATDTVTVRLQNETGGTIDLADSRLTVLVIPQVPKGYLGELTGAVVNDFASLVDGAGASKDVTVVGAELGDYAVASLGVDTVDFCVSASVKAKDTVTVRVQNETTGTVNLASTTVRALVIPKASLGAPAAVEVRTTVET